MALQITALCTNCWACEPLCPTQAIAVGPPHFRINAQQCNECEGYYADPQCASICPVEGAILNAQGQPLNPAGSLTGIVPTSASSLPNTENPKLLFNSSND